MSDSFLVAGYFALTGAWGLVVLWCVWNVHSFRERIRRWDRRSDRRARVEPAPEPPAVVIVPVKGSDPDLPRNISALRSQKYPGYRILFVVETEEDPAHRSLLAAGVGSISGHEQSEPVDARVVVAGLAESGGQKVHNLLAALEHLRPEDEVVVFADVDAVPHDRWLWLLLERIDREGIGATTGYRWLVPASPADDNLPTRLASVLNASVATLTGPYWRAHAWGGSTAIRRDVIDEADLRGHWRGALSDDYQLTAAVRAAGYKVFFVPRCLVTSPARFTWGSLLEFGRRQYLITRIHSPGIWLVGLMASWLYVAGFASSLAAIVAGGPLRAWAVAALAGVVAADLIRARYRLRVVRALFGHDTARTLAGALRLDALATPLWMTLHALLLLSSAFGRRITWAGIRYEIRSPTDVRILSRPDDPTGG